MKTPLLTVRGSLAISVVLVGCSNPARPMTDAGDAAEPASDAATDGADEGGDAALMPVQRASAPFVRCVELRLRTGGSGFNAGSIYPGPQVPFGLAMPSPDTSSETGAVGFSHCAGYAYDDGCIDGFSHLHLQGAGIVDYGNIGVMPSISMDLTRSRSNALPRARMASCASAPRAPRSSAIMSVTSTRASLPATEQGQRSSARIATA